ncbi:MAG: alpha/beta fold hydrolase [Planctomycetota bacterium]|jgi:pimeloyl-ACP methyl ester carboxylesterase
MRRIVRRGSLQLHSYSEGEGPAILLLPGLGGGAALFGTLPRRFARQGYRCLSFDPLGIPPSDPLPAPHDFELAAADVLALLDEHGIEKCHLLGTSMGGKVAMHFAASMPARVDRLVILASSARPTPRSLRIHRFFEILATAVEGPEFAEALAPFLFGGSFLERKSEMVDDILRAIRPDAEVRRTMIAQARSLQGHDASVIAAKIRCPTLCIAGGEDFLTLPEDVQATAELIPGAKFLLMGRAGHSLLLEEPATFEAVLTFLSEAR